jgi:hypothetical protein
MKQPKESSTESKKVNNLALLSSTERLALRETLTQTEAQEWVRRYRKKAMECGKKEAFHWWLITVDDIAKKRGQKSAEDLRNRMNTLKERND